MSHISEHTTMKYYLVHAYMYAKLLQSCLILCDPMGYSPPGSSVCGDSPAKNTGEGCQALLPNPGIKPTSLMSPALAGGFFTIFSCVIVKS